jgi:hypothetical protein
VNQERFAFTRVFDATTFSGSIMLLLGLVSPTVLAAIGEHQAFPAYRRVWWDQIWRSRPGAEDRRARSEAAQIAWISVYLSFRLRQALAPALLSP